MANASSVKTPVFSVGDAVVYPSHGVGTVRAVETQTIAGFEMQLYVVYFEKEKMQIKVPTAKVKATGMRPVSDAATVDLALKLVAGRSRTGRGIWSRRAQELEAKINSGDIMTLAEVVRDLSRGMDSPEKSFSERQIYENAMARMAGEIALVRDVSNTEAIRILETTIAKSASRGKSAANEDALEDAEEAA